MPAQVSLSRFYPIVPDAEWAARLAPLGVRTMQLRMKDRRAADVREEITTTLELGRRFYCQMIINDHWREAIEAKADFIHLGQEDLASADLVAIRRAGLRIGISTHDEAELETALSAGADYIALGPIYETKLKAMRFGPQGLDRVRDWKRRIGDIPLVAIGGITPGRAPGVIAAGADSIAVITDFFTHADPETRVRQWAGWAGAR